MKTTLQARLAILMVLFSIFLIAAFTAVQLNNQLKRTQELNVYRSKQEAFIVRERLQGILGALDRSQDMSSVTAKVKEAFLSVLESGTTETVSLLDKDGKPLVIEGNLKLFSEDAKEQIGAILASGDSSKWLIPSLDRKHKIANIFVILDVPAGYIAKLSFSLGNIQATLNQVYGPVLFVIFIVIAGSVILSIFLSRILIAPIKLLNAATRDVASGNLEEKIFIKTNDELEELADTFNSMTVALRKMKERAENANPLTKLPGNIVIQEEAEKRIKGNEKFALIYADLDNFKAFNDKYGVHAGDKVITLTADVFKEAVAKKGKPEDFIGHEGGDDFLLLCPLERVADLTGYITGEFDKRVRQFFSAEDLEKGYIEAKARNSEEIKKFPITTISLAGVNNATRTITSYAQLTNIAAEVKKGAKNMNVKGSRFLMDRRTDDQGPEKRVASPLLEKSA